MPADPDCIFCKIVAGQIPCHKIFEDDQVLSFLDIGPLAEGHTLVIPKDHYPLVSEMPGEAVAAVTAHLPRLARAVMAATGVQGCNILVNNGKVSGQEVEHVHWHIIPRVAGDGLGYRWNASEYAEGRAEMVLDAVKKALSS